MNFDLTPPLPSRVWRRPSTNGQADPGAGNGTPVARVNGLLLAARDPRDRRRRAINVFVAIVGIVILSPLMILIALAIKLTSPGPVLFRQDRIGLDRRGRGGGSRTAVGRRARDRGGRVFTIFKFRTMRVLKEGERAQVWATPDDPRITKVGRILRRYRLDEIPQLFNVLKGDMNVVGPRPEQPEIFEQLRPEVDRFSERQRVLPGITGWAQVNRGYDQCLDDVRRKVGLDLEYIRRRSPAEDLRIMARTLPVMMKRKGGH
jgi:lipopolysaccharide/colanic/teichoic acid biosynthesis glycosyltransferase